MRLVMRAVVYLAMPFVAFAWLFELEFPTWQTPLVSLSLGSSPLLYLLEALFYAALGAVVVAALVGIVKLLGLGSPPAAGGRIRHR